MSRVVATKPTLTYNLRGYRVSSRRTCLIFGGSGYIGCHLAARLRHIGRFERIVLADIEPPKKWLADGVAEYVRCDVRAPISEETIGDSPAWIFNLAAVHREPGHEPIEYFETNLRGARHVTEFAARADCRNLFFTSSISVYGPTDSAIDEAAPICPITPYGSSKYAAELTHEAWRSGGPDRRLIICRPGVVYGPHDPGNILRMIRAIKGGYFVIPGSPRIRKSYAYIAGLLDSVEFVMDHGDPYVCYNYVETPTEPLSDLISRIRSRFDVRMPTISLPLPLLLPLSHAAALFIPNTAIHPTRVRKAATQTWIVPKFLEEAGFEFRYPFGSSLEHWLEQAPHDF